MTRPEFKTFPTVKQAFACMEDAKRQGKRAYYCGYVKNGRVVWEVEIYDDNKKEA